MLQLAGAVAFLLWGIRTVRTGFERLLGARFEGLVAMLAGRRLRAAAFGGVAALAVQSATAVVLMAASFRSGGMLTLAAAIAIIAGAEFGSSVAVAILTLDLSVLAPALLLCGFAVFSRFESRSGKHIGRILLGFGFVLTALALLSAVAAQLRDAPESREIIAILANKTTMLMIATALLTWAMHSSVAVLLMAAQLVGAGVAPVEAGLWMVVGANLGAALPAISSGWSMGVRAQQALLGAACLRLGAVMAAIVVLSVPALRDTAAIGFVTSDLALLHVALNATLLCLALPFVRRIAALIQAAWPAAEGRDPDADHNQEHIFLAPEDVADPERAFLNISNETLRVSHIIYRMIEEIDDLFRDGDAIARVRKLDDDVDALHRQTTLYLAAMKFDQLSEAQRKRWFELFEFVTQLEHVGDIIATNIAALARRKHKLGLEFSREGGAEIEALANELGQIFRHSQAVFLSGDSQQAEALISAKRRYREQSRASQRRHAMRLSSGVSTSVESSRIHLDLLRDLQRVNSLLSAIAYPHVEGAG